MIKTLTSHGNSAALIIDKPIMELLGITLDTLLRVTTDGRSLVVTPINDEERGDAFADAMEQVNRRHSRTLKRLAQIEHE